jgi:hypothetical protein
MTHDTSPAGDPQPGHPSLQPTDRRSFFKWIGAGLGSTAFLSGCGVLSQFDDLELPIDTGTDGPVTLDFSTDVGVLNYAYVLEQLEAAFYVRAVADPYDGITDEERRVLRDLRNHEVIHREFYRQGIPLFGTAAPALTFDFSAVDFSSRASVLGTARVFEDLGVSAYNGAGPLLADPAILTVAGKIVSVEARHAAAIRDLLEPLSPFSIGEDESVALDPAGEGAGARDVIDANGLDRAFMPPDVLAAAAAFVVNPISVTGLDM